MMSMKNRFPDFDILVKVNIFWSLLGDTQNWILDIRHRVAHNQITGDRRDGVVGGEFALHHVRI